MGQLCRPLGAGEFKNGRSLQALGQLGGLESGCAMGVIFQMVLGVAEFIAVLEVFIPLTVN